MRFAVLGFDRGRHSVKACLIHGDEEHNLITPSVAVPEPRGADPEGEAYERITVLGRPYLVGSRALASSPDAVFRTTGSKTTGDAGKEFLLSFMGVLAWASAHVDLQKVPLMVVTSAPDSEYDHAMMDLKEILTDCHQFQTGDGRYHRVDVTRDQVKVMRESTAPLMAQVLRMDGEQTGSPLMWTVQWRPGDARAVETRALVVGIGFRDWNVATALKGKRLESRSGVRGVSEIYAALWDTLRGPEIRATLRNRAEVDQILNGDHPIWTHRDPDQLHRVIRKVIAEQGQSLLTEAMQWAGSPEEYHAVLAAGGGALMLEDLITKAFPKAIFAKQGDSARGLAYSGVRLVR